MKTVADKDQLLNDINRAARDLVDMVSGMDETTLNSIPYKDSWTAGQLIRHVTKSIKGMTGALEGESQDANRDPGEHIPQLKKVFLDFSTKMKSPEFIIPEPGPFQKGALVDDLLNAVMGLRDTVVPADLSGLVTGLPLGPITKLEILHFTLYHTQRHRHQLGNITAALHKINA